MSETNERRPRRDGAASMPSVPEPSDESWVRYGIPRDDALRILSCPECVADMRQAHRDFGRRGGPGDYAIFGVWKTVAVDFAPTCFASEETLSKSFGHIPSRTVGECLDVLRRGGLLIATPRRGRTTIYTLRPCPHQEPRRHAHEVESESAQATAQATERATSQATEQVTEQAYTRRTEWNGTDVNETCPTHGTDIDQRTDNCYGCRDAKRQRDANRAQRRDESERASRQVVERVIALAEVEANRDRENIEPHTFVKATEPGNPLCDVCNRMPTAKHHRPMPG